MGGHAVVGFVFVFACTLAPPLVYLFSGPRRGVALTVDVHVSVLQHTDTMSSRPRVIPPPRAQPCVVLRHACVALSSRVPLRRDRFAALQRQRTLCSQPACHCVQISRHCGAAAPTHTVFAARARAIVSRPRVTAALQRQCALCSQPPMDVSSLPHPRLSIIHRAALLSRRAARRPTRAAAR